MSLAVWIGGASAEIDEVRRGVPGSFWARVLGASGYDRVVVDILAGASAGGLNGAIYAASQVYGFDMAALKDLWVRLGDTARLLRRQGSGWPSLFRGDEYFFTQVEEQLRVLVAGGTAPSTPAAVSLRLSATLVEPIRRPGRSPGDELLTHQRYASGFALSRPWYDWLPSDFPDDAAQGLAGPQPWSSRLAMAARSTSSFPGAFEAAVLRCPRPARFGLPPGDDQVGVSVSMTGTFLDRGGTARGGDAFLVSDGGILDNIPLGRALDAIAQAPADSPTERFLIYVQPGMAAAATAAAAGGLERRRAAGAVLKGVLGARLRSEDILGDLAQLDEYNTGIERARTLRRGAFESLTDPGALRVRAEASWSGYRLMRALEDQRLVSGLLEDPLGFLGEDPFPATVAGQPVTDDRWRSPWDDPRPGGFVPLSRDRLAVLLTETFTTRLPVTPGLDAAVFGVGALPLLRVCQLLIEWAQYLESAPGGDPAASRHKATLYRVASFVRAAIDRPRRLAWVTLAATVPDDAREADLVRVAPSALTGLLRVPADQAQGICRALLDDDAAVLAGACADRVAALDRLPGLAWSAPTDPDPGWLDLRTEVLAHVLLPVAQQLRALPGGRGRQPDPSPVGGFYLDRVIPDPVTVEALAALEVVTFPEFATGLPGRRPVRFQRLSSANETPLAPYFTALLDAAADPDGPHAGKWWDHANQDRATQRGIHVDLKLAGNDIANFSAFLDQGWRGNDWMWGCLDAVPTLVELLVTPHSLAAHLTGAPDRWAAVEQLVLGPAPGPYPLLRQFQHTHVLTPARAAIDTELDALLNPAPIQATAQPRATRRALTAARQWQIVAEQHCPQALSAVSGRVATPEEADTFSTLLLATVAGYHTGAQTIRSPGPAPAIGQRLAQIGEAAVDVLLYNAQLVRPTTFGTPGSKPRAVIGAARAVARLAARRIAVRATRSH